MTDKSFRNPAIALPFIIVTLIWGSTWIIIKDQLGVVPPGWSVTYRFALAGMVMLAVAAFTGARLRLSRREQMFALLLGVAQFTLNFNLVYRAELYITSGLVAVIFALLFLPNALLARIFLGHRMSARFVAGSVIAVAGLMLLFIHEARGDSGERAATLTGIALTLCAVSAASVANVMQATSRAKALPLFTMLGYAMLWGALIDGAAAWIETGPPVFEMRLGYVAGIVFLGIVASAVAFPLYFRSIRDIGPAKAAYSSVLIPVIAMGFSTAFEGYRWSLLAAAGSAIALTGMFVALSAASPSRNEG